MTTQNNIIQIAISTPLRRTFDYLCPDDIDHSTLKPGMRVKVPFGSRTMTGILLKKIPKSDLPISKLKKIIEVIDDEPIIDKNIFKLCNWASHYYHHSFGDVLFNAIPILLRQGKSAAYKAPKTNEVPLASSSHKPTLNEAQTNAIEIIQSKLNQYHCYLLDGVTGSGKTEVYLNLIQTVLDNNQQALVLVPEIALTPQTFNRFQNRFDIPIVNLHSGMTPRERLNAWVQAKSGEAKIIIGTRSAIFTQFKNLGIIIIDEEHDLSFKQHEGFRYSARDCAIVRASFENIPIVLGSATPSFESLFNVQKDRYSLIKLPERAGNAIHPRYHLLDIRNEHLEHGLSKQLIQIMDQHLKNNNQVLLFLNRRGFSPILMCHSCGWIATCSRCDAKMTLHKNPARLHCHHCEKTIPIHEECPSCHQKNLLQLGVGTERLEQALHKIFSDIPITRIDRDTTRQKNSIETLLNQMNASGKQILVGTQMIAKGHHFPNVTFVGIIDADGGFFSADFRATERIGQTLIQVSGRAGRAEKPGEVYIQTHHPDHPLLLQLTQQGYQSFAQLSLQERQAAHMPPYSYFALIRAHAVKAETPDNFLTAVKKLISDSKKEIDIFGPIPALMHRRKGYFNAQLLLQSSNRSALQETLDQLIPKIETLKLTSRVKWSLDVDPLEIF